MRINQNISAMSAYRSLTAHESGVTRGIERLSSGLRINRAADDAAGLAISETMRAQVGGLNQAQRNAVDGISLVQTADGALNETHAILQRMRTLAVQAGNGDVLGNDGLRAIQAEMSSLTSEIDRIATSTQFNGSPLLDGTFRGKLLQVGANAGDTLPVDITSGITPAVAARPAGAALWDVYNRMGSLGSTVTVSQTTAAGSTNVSVALPSPPPTTVEGLAAALNADSAFKGAFTATTGYHVFADGTRVEDANLIIMAKTPGQGPVSVTGVPNSRTDTDPGADARPEQAGGYGSIDLLGGPLDVTRRAGASTVTTTTGGTQGFGFANDVPTTTTYTQTWGSGADDALARIDRAIQIVSTGRAELGATQNRLDHTIRNLGVSAENLTMSESRIRDADMAREVVELQKRQTMYQASMQMLSQANQVPQSILKLLG